MKKLFLLLALFGVLCSSCSDAGDEINNQQNPTEEPENGGDIQQCSEIWYTSTDGNIVEPYDSEAFNVPILSNTYQNGMGVIRFDGDVTTIGDFAFYRCSSLTSVTIPDSVTEIRRCAFSGCSSLTSVTIPDSVTEIGSEVFYGCNSLQEFNGKFASEDGRCLIIDGTLNAIAPAGLTEYTIPDSVTTIGVAAFASCTSLTSVTIPDSVTTIGVAAFSHCTSLPSVTIPDSVTTIGNSAFYVCSSLTSVTIPDSVTTIEGSAFSDCSSLQEFNGKFASEDGRCLIIDGTLISFAPAGLTEYTIPDSVTEIGGYAFAHCSSLTSVTIPDSVTTIGYDAFWDCTSLTSVTIPDSVTTIGNGAFWGCESLTSVTIGNSVTDIGERAFCNCSSLTSVTIGDSVTDIGDRAFTSCSSLTSVTIGDSVTTIGDLAFCDCSSLTSVTIPDSVTSIGDYAFQKCTSLESVTLGKGLTTINDYAFSVCPSLKHVVIPEGVTAIGYASFWDCTSLETVTLPKSLTISDSYAFQNCEALKALYISDLDAWYRVVFNIPETDDGVTYFTANPLSYARNLYLNGKLLTEIVIPDDVTEIKQLTFVACKNIKTLTIHEKVKSIGTCAFWGCIDIDDIYCRPTTPPVLAWGVFKDWDLPTIDCIIHVPSHCVETYKNHSSWRQYKSQIIDLHDHHEYVDLGLSVRWACCNVGANSPEEYGYYLAWGDNYPKESYTEENCNSIGISVCFGHNWPTVDQMEELCRECTWEWTTRNRVKGYKVTGPNGNSIFLPAAGFRSGTESWSVGSCGLYWSCESYDVYGDYYESPEVCYHTAICMTFERNSVGFSNYQPREVGCTVRQVVK